MDSLEPWYSPCIAIRTIKYMLHIRPNLTPQEWTQLLKFEKDEEIGERWRSRSGLPRGSNERAMVGRTDSASLVLSLERIGVGSEARWNSESMDLTMPAMWREAQCGGMATTMAAAASHGIIDYLINPFGLLVPFALLIYWRMGRRESDV